MKNTQNIQINLLASETVMDDINHCHNIHEVLTKLKNSFDAGGQENLSFSPSIDVDALKAALEAEFNLTAREGISGGCYGARDGKSYKGLTLFVSPCEFPDRWLDGDGDEVVNSYHSIVDNCESELDCDGEVFERYVDVFNIKEVVHENTCNSDGEGVYQFFQTNYKIYQCPDDTVIMAAEFHCGGDVRGNYASARYFRFDSIDDVYCAMLPSPYLKEA